MVYCKDIIGRNKVRSRIELYFVHIILIFNADGYSQIYSQFNRYDLSYPVLEADRKKMTDSNSGDWFSIRGSECGGDTNNGFVFRADDQIVSSNMGLLAGFEYSSESSRFGVIQGSVNYHAPYLKACISADVYSTERRVVSPVNDVQFERFIKENGEKPIVGVFDFRGNLPEAYLSTGYRSLSLTIGKQKMRWGPGYKGTLGLSGANYSPFYFYNVDCAFGTLLNMKAFLCGYDDESIYRKELTIVENIIVTNNKTNLRSFLPRYGAGQRLDFSVGKYIQVGIYELVDFFGSNELNRFANPLQLYYLSNETSGTNNANLLAGLDVNVVAKRFRIYGEFINDDITFLEQAGNPDKYAVQGGIVYYGRSPLLQTGIEYTHVSRYVYGHSRVLSRHSIWEESLGWPWGNYMDVVTAYALFSFPKNVNGRIEANYWLKGNGSISDDWYTDKKPDLDHAPYFPEHPTKIYSAIISAEYSPIPWLTCCFYYEPVVQHSKLTNGFYTYLAVGLPGKREVRAD